MTSASTICSIKLGHQSHIYNRKMIPKRIGISQYTGFGKKISQGMMITTSRIAIDESIIAAMMSIKERRINMMSIEG